MEFLLIIFIMFGGLFVMSYFGKRSQAKKADAREEMLDNQMVPGAWAQTYSGFFGRYVDQDGDVVILETPSGEETYWLQAAIRTIGEPPFEILDEDTDDGVDISAPSEDESAEDDN